MENSNKAFVLPVVLVSFLVIEVFLYGLLGLYKNKLYSYRLLTDHYQAETLYKMTKADWKEKQTSGAQASSLTRLYRFNLGTVELTVSPAGDVYHVDLQNAYEETFYEQKETEAEKASS